MKSIVLFVFLMACHLLRLSTAIAQIDMEWDVNSSYGRQEIAGFRLGGLDVALSDRVPNANGNPAHLSDLDRVSVYGSLRNVRASFDFVNQITHHHTSARLKPEQTIGYGAIGVPVFKRLVLAVSYNGEQMPVIKTRSLSNTSMLFSTMPAESGVLRSMSIAVAFGLEPNVSIGLGVTKGMGKAMWRDDFYGGGSIGFPSPLWHSGLACHAGRFQFGAVVYFPHTSLKAEGNPYPALDTDPSSRENIRGRLSIHKNYNVKFGMAYDIRKQLTLAVNYGHRFSSVFYLDDPNTHSNWKSRSSNELALGIEYRTKAAKAELPVYIAYQARWLPNTDFVYPSGFFTLSRNDEQRFRQRILIGANWQRRSFALHVAAAWSHDNFRIIENNIPPWS